MLPTAQSAAICVGYRLRSEAQGKGVLAVLTRDDIDALNILARDLAKRIFGGAGKVERSDGTVRLTILKPASGGATLYRSREMYSSSYETASLEVALVIDTANDYL